MTEKLKEEVIKEEVTQEKIEMKKLKATHFFIIAKICKTINLDVKALIKMFTDMQKEAKKDKKIKGKNKKEVAEIFEDGTPEYVMNFIDTIYKKIFLNLPLIEDEIKSILCDLTGKTKEEIDNLDMVVFISLIKRLVSDQGFMAMLKS